MKNDDYFLQTMHSFIQIFDLHTELYEKQLDIHGIKNLCVVTTKNGPRLLFLDPHYRGSAAIEKDKEKFIRERIEYLKSVINSVRSTATMVSTLVPA